MTVSTFARFAPLLRRAGFRKEYDSRSGGCRTVEWTRQEPDGRLLNCQLWADGGHRVSHSWIGCSDTLPTSFRTEKGLADAIERERTRIDSRYRDPGRAHNA